MELTNKQWEYVFDGLARLYQDYKKLRDMYHECSVDEGDILKAELYRQEMERVKRLHYKLKLLEKGYHVDE